MIREMTPWLVKRAVDPHPANSYDICIEMLFLHDFLKGGIINHIVRLCVYVYMMKYANTEY